MDQGNESGTTEPGPAPTAPQPPPERAAETTPVAVGTAVWALLFVIGLFIRDDLAAGGREWWIWACAAGVVLGLVGYGYLWRRWSRRPAGSENT